MTFTAGPARGVSPAGSDRISTSSRARSTLRSPTLALSSSISELSAATSAVSSLVSSRCTFTTEAKSV
ncbi:hypothetical protein [Nocardioides sp. B-3]|uniref:hypothetical protein n=1 Tax=Nocardioides sp. B-3 TaxID=2895565 RepID=UPI0021532387|nr:hypothetical protein [Nocardioides sp. B-3]UUZ61076.1 hypothetical protein LP418_10705 [Nocardioides sp. B-3]